MASVDTLSFGGAVKRLIKQEGIKQIELANELNIPAASVSRMLSDAGGSPSLKRVLAVLETCNCSLAVVSKDADLPEGSILLHE